MIRASLLVALAAAVLAVPSARPAAAQAKARKVAFLVGVGSFKHNLTDLSGCPENDVGELAKTLTAGGFEVIALTGREATKAAIEARFLATLKGNGNPQNALGKDDVLMVALCSHGFTFETVADGQRKEEPFVAGYDALPGDGGTMVNLNGLIRTATPFGASTFFLVDACREHSDPNRGTVRGIEGQRMTLPARTAVLFSCGRGQVAHQSDGLKHGLFTFAVLKVLRGETGLADEVSWAELVAGVGKAFRSNEFKKHLPAGRAQMPVEAKGETEDTTLLALKPGGNPMPTPKKEAERRDRTAGEEVDVEVADGVRMTFCWIPPGRTTLGLPGTTPPSTNPAPERPYQSKGYWLGKFEVTQEQWLRVMKDDHKCTFTPTNEDVRKAGITDTSQFPVDSVSLVECRAFAAKLNPARGGAAAALGGSGAFVVPTEDEWEYACRGGLGNDRRYYFGDTMREGQANFNSKLNRPCRVTDTNDGKYPPHPWGLMHMHGNIQEWCDTIHEGKNYLVRGGAYHDSDGACTAHFRYGYDPATGPQYNGFRLCYRPN